MDRAGWQRISSLFDELVDLNEHERNRRLSELAATDEEAYGELLRLLAADARADTPLSRRVGSWATDAVAPIQLEVRGGAEIGPWKIKRLVGRGGMGSVYLAERHDNDFEQRVALKVLSRADPDGELANRFALERRILAGLQHPHIARFVDGGTTADGLPWFAMEFVEGESICQWCERSGASIRETVRLFDDVCSAVSFAHQRLVVHRDLKPSNILVSEAEGVKLLDFGIAKILEPDETAGITRTALRVLTPRYAAPEQVRGEPIGTATDVYGLGAVLYELLGGHAPFADRAKTEADFQRMILEEDPAELPNSIDTDLRTIVGMALNKEAGRRYPSVEALREDLARFARHEPVRARPATAAYRLGRFLRRNRAGLAVAAIVLLLGGLGVGSTLWQARRASEQGKRAEEVSQFLIEIFEQANEATGVGEALSAGEILDAGARRLAGEMYEQPRLRSELYLILTDLNTELGRYAQAESLGTIVVEETRRGFGDPSPQLVKALTVLTRAMLEGGHLDRADSMLAWAEKIELAIHGETGPNMSTIFADRANVAGRRGESDQAIQLYRQALAIDRSRADVDPLEIATDLSNLAVEYGRATRYVEADSLDREALQIREAQLGSEHPLVAVSLHNLAAAAENLGQPAVAESLYLRSMEIMQARYPRGHADIAGTLTSLGILYRGEGRLDEAVEALSKAAALHRAVSSGRSYELGRTENALGTLAYSMGDYAEAVRRFEAAYEVFALTIGPDAPGALTSLNNAGVILHLQGHLEAARAQFERVLDIRRKSLGDDHPQIAYSRKSLGMLAVDEGDYVRAREELERALSTFEEIYADERTIIGEIYLGLGRCALAEGDDAAARALLRRAEAELMPRLAEGHRIRVQLDQSLAQLGDTNR